jgi:hypothetical protein
MIDIKGKYCLILVKYFAMNVIARVKQVYGRVRVCEVLLQPYVTI